LKIIKDFLLSKEENKGSGRKHLSLKVKGGSFPIDPY
jgi:hypothetical protein